MLCVRDSRTIVLERSKRGWGLHEFSRLVGAHYSTIAKIEKGRTKIAPKTAAGISHVLEIPFEELFEVVEHE